MLTFQRTLTEPPLYILDLMATINSAPWRGRGPGEWKVTDIHWVRLRDGHYRLLTTVEPRGPGRLAGILKSNGSNLTELDIYPSTDFRRIPFGRLLRKRKTKTPKTFTTHCCL